MYFVHKGHQSGGELLGGYKTAEEAAAVIASIALKVFELEGNDAVGERTYTIVKARTPAAAARIVNQQYT